MQISLSSNLNYLAPVIVDDLARVGSKHDSGYVVSEIALTKADALLSFGLSDNWAFEEEFFQLHPQAPIHVYDYSVSKHFFFRRFRKALKKVVTGRLSKISTLKDSWKTYCNYKIFFSNQHQHFVEKIHNRIDAPGDATIDVVMQRLDSKNIFFKMDIEGSEYRVIKDLLRYSDRILAMAIEFHDLEPLRATFEENIKEIQKKYTIIHLHPNNEAPLSADGLPECIEISFLRNDLCSGTQFRKELPIKGLDTPNNPAKEEYCLSFNLSGA